MGKPQFSHAQIDRTRGLGYQTRGQKPNTGSNPSDAVASASACAAATSTLSISETFRSRQGEGKLTGTDSFFIRTSGCNLRCWFCDTPYASWNPVGENRSIESLVASARDSKVDHVVLTGGEPLLPSAVSELATALMQAGFHLTIETAGTIDRPIACDLLSLSPKLADSTPDPRQHPRWSRVHEVRRMPIGTMRKLIDQAKQTQVKFVVGNESQFDEVHSIVAELCVPNEDIFIMPQGVTVDEMDAAARWLMPWCESVGYQYCDRLQIRWFGNRRGT